MRGVVACDTVGRDANVKIGRITKVHVGAVRASGYKFWSFGISHMADIAALSEPNIVDQKESARTNIAAAGWQLVGCLLR